MEFNGSLWVLISLYSFLLILMVPFVFVGSYSFLRYLMGPYRSLCLLMGQYVSLLVCMFRCVSL